MAARPAGYVTGPITFIGQAIDAVPRMTRLGTDDRRSVMFFGLLVGIILNFDPDRVVRFDLEGQPLEVLPKASLPGEVELSIGGRRIEPTTMAKAIGSHLVGNG